MIQRTRQIGVCSAVSLCILLSAGGCGSGNSNATAVVPASIPVAAQPDVGAASRRQVSKTAQDWPQFGYDSGHSGYNPLESTIDLGNVSKLQVSWNDQSIIQPTGVVVSNKVAYVDSENQTGEGLYALDATTGAQKWFTDLHLYPFGEFNSVAAVVGNVVVSPCSSGDSSNFQTGICGVNASSGKVLWKQYCTEYQQSLCGGITNSGTPPVAYDNRIYYQNIEQINDQPDTLAVEPATGKIVWDIGGAFHCPDAGQNSGEPLPAANGLVYAVRACGAGTGQTELCALSASSGKAAWCDATSTVVGDTVVADGMLFVTEYPGSTAAVLYALDAKSGARDWTQTLPSAFPILAVANDRVVVEDGSGDGTGGLLAFSEKTGHKLWSVTTSGGYFAGGVVSIANGIVYVSGSVALSAYNEKTGAFIWASDSNSRGGANATPAILNGAVYTGCYTMCAFTLASQNGDSKRSP